MEKIIAGGISVGFSFSKQPFRTFGDDNTKNAPGRHNFWQDLGIYRENNTHFSFQWEISEEGEGDQQASIESFLVICW